MSQQPTHWRANRFVHDRLGDYLGSKVDRKRKVSLRRYERGIEVKPFGKAPFRIENKLIKKIRSLNKYQREAIGVMFDKEALLEQL